MRRLVALLLAMALLIPSAGLAAGANGGSGDTAAGPHAFGRFLIREYGGEPFGWVTIDVRSATPDNPDPGLFRFEALEPDVTGYPSTTRAAITATDWYHEAGCCGYPDVLIIWGVECQYFANGNFCRDFIAGFYDVGPGVGQDFFRWGNVAEDMVEFGVAEGTLTVTLGPDTSAP